MTGDRLGRGGMIDRRRPLDFRFNGRPYRGIEGDSLASALLASGASLTGRSFKYHRPRGIISCGIDEPGTIVELLGRDASGNLAAPSVPLRDGLNARTVNCWPSPQLDVGAVNRIFAPLLPAGFYYKTFFRPGWRHVGPLIRRAAGLGHAPGSPPPCGRFETRNRHCDVLVVGAGPAGLALARTVAAVGASVIIVDRGTAPGGCLLNRRVDVDGMRGSDWASACHRELLEHDRVDILLESEAWAVREHNLVMVNERAPHDRDVIERSWSIRARHLAIAAGSGERMLVFPNNDRPGVMLASAVQAYVNRYAVRPGRRAVILANNDSAHAVARDMQAAGIEVAAIIDSRQQGADSVKPGLDGVEMLPGHQIISVAGQRRVGAVSVGPVGGGPSRRIRCDLLAVSGGWDPSVRLWSQARGALEYDESACAFLPSGRHPQMICVGGSAGLHSVSQALADGVRAGSRIAESLGLAGDGRCPHTEPDAGYRIEPFWCNTTDSGAGSAFVDILNDVTLADIRLAMREGLSAVEHVKRYTTAGMGFNQGRTIGPNIAGLMAGTLGRSPGEIGLTTHRSPTSPVSFGSIAGGRAGPAVLPFRHTPITRWNIDRGAVMYEAGSRWRRPGYFPGSGESMQEAVNRESLAVRERVGVYDGSPLGTIALKGRDVGRLVDMIFTNNQSGTAVGMGRYGIMLTDDGRMLDDGVAFRIGEHEYLLSVSTGNAPAVYRHISRFLAVDRPEWQVRMTDLTCQWMNATICGPDSRKVLAELGTDIDLDRDAFPFMAWREGVVAGIPSRVIRVSFTGSLSFEINVRPRDLLPLWERIIETGSRFGIAPIGSEANHVLRVEKGFLSMGHEADGTVDPHDLGFGWLMSRKKTDFIGRRSVLLRRQAGSSRRELVGLLTEDAARTVPEGAPITPNGKRCRSEGFVSASVWSVVNGRAVALGLLEDGRRRMGETAWIRVKEERIAARIVKPCFYDPDGSVLKS